MQITVQTRDGNTVYRNITHVQLVSTTQPEFEFKIPTANDRDLLIFTGHVVAVLIEESPEPIA